MRKKLSGLLIMVLLAGGVFAQSKVRVKRSRISQLETIVQSNPDTRYLIMKRTGLTRIPVEIEELEKLDSLDLYSNRIQMIPDSSVYLLENIRYLRMGKNPMRYLPASIARLRNLETLDLWNAEIDDFAPEFLQMTWLKKLDLRQTRLSRDQLQQIRDALPDTDIKATWQCDCK
jgi:internalin A